MRAIVLVGCVAASACALLTDLGDLADPDAGSVDSPTESSANDASDAGTKSPCAVQHAFCDDFDHGALGATWDGVLDGSGPLALSTTSVTPPDSFQTTANATGASALVKNLPASDHTHVEFDLMVQNPASTTGTIVDVITLEITQPPSGVGYADIGLERSGGTSLFEVYATPTDGGVASVNDYAVNEAFASWRHVAIDLTFSTETAVLTIDGVVAQSVKVSPALDLSPITISLGAPFVVGTSGAWNVFVDDFFVDQN